LAHAPPISIARSLSLMPVRIRVIDRHLDVDIETLTPPL
jgi:hypothetical protein